MALRDELSTDNWRDQNRNKIVLILFVTYS
jgi:hypothetical protein